MLILALDTSGETCSVAVVDGETLRAAYDFRHERRLTERLPAIVQFVLRDAGITLSRCEAFAVGVGPGSFTGVRVAVTFAKLWAEVEGTPLVGVSSLDAMAASLVDVDRAAVAPSRRDEVILAEYRAGSLTPEDLPALRPSSALPSGVPILGEVSGAATRIAFPRATDIGWLARTRLDRGESDSPERIAPLYVAPTPVGAS